VRRRLDVHPIALTGGIPTPNRRTADSTALPPGHPTYILRRQRDSYLNADRRIQMSTIASGFTRYIVREPLDIWNRNYGR
jgi:hypothetical protein